MYATIACGRLTISPDSQKQEIELREQKNISHKRMAFTKL